ncbi:homeobox-leucine zipper protein HOX18 [Brachypodium distachyon]|uniref:Homeobox domain-containing protein n=1 Tax=Brachypodium distachyon TaxID=15368 RepID=A0A0Q3RX66_BRADI|nr:homeobox-leucine zipper protein HOX18 [Brachypodium distachyon]KQK17346.1 hypothetical protein BRADI_1g33870v3 [Brachypodium distachyon]|eukprot:XP_010227405.1 homeobox-leucine zipper protein HOX18 [Brachypodium distachyon]
MEQEDFSSWLGLATGGSGGAVRRSQDGAERRRAKEETACERQQLAAIGESGGEGATKQRISVRGGGRSPSNGPCPSDGGSDDVAGGSTGTRKKLRLTKEQCTLLEDSFHAHVILSQVQKQELARRLNLSPRQVEVWFQNRRARTKLKQTEVECEFLKRCCESLTDENQRLKHELLDLQRSAGPRAAAAAMLNFCPACEKVTLNN